MGTKLLAPMFFMLTVVLVIVIVPAFLSMQFKKRKKRGEWTGWSRDISRNILRERGEIMLAESDNFLHV